MTERGALWASTMRGHEAARIVTAHAGGAAAVTAGEPVTRADRERVERLTLRDGAALARGAGRRARPEAPDPERTCFERDRDRIVHSAAFRRLAGKTQVVVYPKDHQRTRLTHALEVAQVATAIARGIGVNVTLTEAIALGHDCGHGPGGHASEDAFTEYIPGGYSHGPWGADVALFHLNLTHETLDGIRRHSWSEPAPVTVEGEIVSWADRIAYCAHDLEDAVSAGIVALADVPDAVVEVAGRRRSSQLRAFIRAVTETSGREGTVGMDAVTAAALAELRQFNYERIYMRPDSVAQAQAVIEVLRGLVDYLIAHPAAVPDFGEPPATLREVDERVWRAVAYVAGMTDRFAFEQAEALLGYDLTRIPPGIGRGVTLP
ncbi:MAG: HD domain-containing protein [Propionibacteriaceae bacterium]|nr:HD domain-containing protein [Propionibacteriaceae bacterium]